MVFRVVVRPRVGWRRENEMEVAVGQLFELACVAQPDRGRQCSRGRLGGQGGQRSRQFLGPSGEKARGHAAADSLRALARGESLRLTHELHQDGREARAQGVANGVVSRLAQKLAQSE